MNTTDAYQPEKQSPLLTVNCKLQQNSWRIARKTEEARTVLSKYNPMTTNYRYDAKGHLTQSAMHFCHEDYTYNGIGQRIQMLHTRKGIFNYTYDAQGKLIQVEDTHFHYDLFCRLSMIVTPNVHVQYFTYERVHINDIDVDRLSAFQDSTGKSYTYYYTPNNPLPVSIQSCGQSVVSYQWEENDELPRLLSCTTNFATWQFGYSEDNEGNLPDTVILTGPAVAHLGYWDLKSLKCTLGYDHLGTVKLIADPFNELVKELEYDSFGSIVSETEPHIYFPFGFAGGLRDIASGFVRFGYRDYDPTVGRFTTPDPALDLRGDGDIYGYCVDDPVNFVDAEGLKFTSADAADAARKGHGGISHPFGAKHGTAVHLSPFRDSELRDSYKDKPIRTYFRAQRPLNAPGLNRVNVGKYNEKFTGTGFYHETFISPDRSQDVGLFPSASGGRVGADDPALLKNYSMGKIEYNADIIDDAIVMWKKKRKDAYDKYIEVSRGKYKGYMRDGMRLGIYDAASYNCQYFPEEIIAIGEQIAKSRNAPFIIRVYRD